MRWAARNPDASSSSTVGGGHGHPPWAAPRSSHLAAYDDAIPGDEHFLDLELHVGDGLGKASDHFDRGIAAPAFAGKIAPARLVVRGEDLLLERLHIALDRLVEQAVPRSDHGARLSLGQTLCRGGQGSGQHGGGGDELSEPLHGVPPCRFGVSDAYSVPTARATTV